MGKIVAALFFTGLALLGFFWFSPGETVIKKRVENEVSRGNGFMVFVDLPKDTLAESSDVRLIHSDIQDQVLLSLQQEKTELAIAISYRQWVLGKDQKVDVTYFTPTPKRSLESIFNQYGLLTESPLSVKFSKSENSQDFVKIDSKIFTLEDLDRSSYQWGAVETKIFQRKLSVIEEKIKLKVLTKKALAAGINTQKFIEEIILGGGRGIASAEKNDRIDEYLNKALDLPIRVNLKEPQFEFEHKPDWTHGLGDPEARIKVILFSDFYSELGRNLLRQLPELSTEHKNIYFGFRPLFPRRDRYQRMLAELGFCAWVSDQSKYWNFIDQAIAVRKESFETETYRAVEEAGIALSPVKKCFFEREHRKVVDYHLDYADYLDIHSGPVMFIDGEILTGGITKKSINKVLARKK